MSHKEEAPRSWVANFKSGSRRLGHSIPALLGRPAKMWTLLWELVLLWRSLAPLSASPRSPPSHTHSYLVPELNQISFLRFGGSRLGRSLKSLMELVRAQRQLGPDPDLLSSDLSAWPLKIRMPPLIKEPAKALDPFTARARAIVPGVYRTCTRDRGMVCVGGGRSSQLWRILRVFEGHSLERGGSSGLCS